MTAIDPRLPDCREHLSAAPLSAFSAVSSRPTGTVQWRSHARGEWIGREGHSAVGTVRRLGADYVAIDSTGMLTGFFSSLAEAESSLSASRHDRRTARTAAVVAAAAGVAALAVTVAGFVVLSL